MNDRQLAPVIIYVYNRPWHTGRTLDALKRNELAAESDLFIFSDAPRSGVRDENIEAVRTLIKSITGFKTVNVIERPENFGLARNIIEGVTDIIEKYGRVIVLEDDILTSPYFLKYMNDALDYYENEDNVVCVHGWMWAEDQEYPPFFLRGTDCWGWATWKKGWDLFEEDGSRLLRRLQEKKLCREFDLGGAYAYTQMLKDQIKGKNSSWAVRWHAAAFIQGKLCLHPGVSMVENIGNDDSGTHCKNTDSYHTKLYTEPIDVVVSPIEESKLMLGKKAAFHKSVGPGILDIVLNKIASLTRKK